ncbi:MAG: hypothetical protein ACOYL8_04920 [Patescibacteria group bacterium]
MSTGFDFTNSSLESLRERYIFLRSLLGEMAKIVKAETDLNKQLSLVLSRSVMASEYLDIQDELYFRGEFN